MQLIIAAHMLHHQQPYFHSRQDCTCQGPKAESPKESMLHVHTYGEGEGERGRVEMKSLGLGLYG